MCNAERKKERNDTGHTKANDHPATLRFFLGGGAAKDGRCFER